MVAGARVGGGVAAGEQAERVPGEREEWCEGAQVQTEAEASSLA